MFSCLAIWCAPKFAWKPVLAHALVLHNSKSKYSNH